MRLSTTMSRSPRRERCRSRARCRHRRISPVGQAEAFILSHIADHITVADAADAADERQRSLQLAFQRDHGFTPMSYLRSIQLLMARQQLEFGTATAAPDVARSVGITHLGGFSSAYRDAFGELPGKTLLAANTHIP